MSVTFLVPMLESFIAEILERSERWVVVVERRRPPLRYVQLLAYEHGREDGGVAVLEAISDAYVDPGDELDRYELQALRYLGWPEPEGGGNHRIVVGSRNASAHDLACQLVASLELAFSCRPDEAVSASAFEVDVVKTT